MCHCLVDEWESDCAQGLRVDRHPTPRWDGLFSPVKKRYAAGSWCQAVLEMLAIFSGEFGITIRVPTFSLQKADDM
jgi:hypothetical protein